jgi:hypothetical protein
MEFGKKGEAMDMEGLGSVGFDRAGLAMKKRALLSLRGEAGRSAWTKSAPGPETTIR